VKEWPFWGFVIWFGTDAHGELFRQSLEKRAQFIGTSKSGLIRGYFRGFSTQCLFF